MKALKRTVLWMGLLCGSLSAVLVLLLQYTPQMTVVADRGAVETFVEIPLSQLAAVTVENQRASYAVLQTPSGPEVVSQIQAEYDNTQLYALLYAATHLSGSRKNTDVSTFVNYGIDTPRSTVTLMLVDGSKRVVQVLMTNPIDQNVYMYDAHGNAVYLVSASVAELFLRDELELMSHMPLPIHDVSDFSSIRSIDMQFGGNMRSYAVSCTDTNYFLTSPIHHRVPSTVVVSQLFIPLLSVYSDSFVAFNADLSQWGFDDAALRLTLQTDQDKTQLWFAYAQDGSCLMARPDTGNVYTVDESVLHSLTFDYLILTGGTALYYGAGDLQRLIFDWQNEQIVAEIESEGKAVTITLDGKRLSSQETSTFLSALNSIPIAEEAQQPPASLAPMLSITATLRSGAVEVTSFTPAIDEYSYLTVLGDTHFVVSNTDIQNLIQILYMQTGR
jgi:hypothetical protein